MPTMQVWVVARLLRAPVRGAPPIEKKKPAPNEARPGKAHGKVRCCTLWRSPAQKHATYVRTLAIRGAARQAALRARCLLPQPGGQP